MSKVIKNDDGVVVVEGTPAAKLVKDSDKFFASKPPERMAGESISQPKMQETSTMQIINCIMKIEKVHNCDQSKKSQMDTKIEINKRFGMPIYIPLISLACCFLLASRKDQKMFHYI